MTDDKNVIRLPVVDGPQQIQHDLDVEIARMQRAEGNRLMMDIAWRDFIMWAYDNPGIRAEFTAATGKQFLPPPRTALDRTIDQMAGLGAGIADAFVLWATEHHWGVDDAPPRVAAEITRRAAIAKATGDGQC